MTKIFYKFKKGKQNELVSKAIRKAGSERKLCLVTGIPSSSFYKYKFEINNLPKARAKTLCLFLNQDFNKLHESVERELDSFWGQRKGGRNLIKKKLIDNTFYKTIKKLNVGSSKWHKKMKTENPEKYYLSQYEKFKKIGNYKTNTLANIKVRNKLEQEVADFLFSEKIIFEYEPYLKIKNNVFFPDFVIDKIIIECTSWKNPSKDKIKNLKRKIKGYNSKKYKIIFFIPEKYRNFYKEINSFIISDLSELKIKMMPP